MSLTERQKEIVNKATLEVMRELGYPEEQFVTAHVAQRIVSLSLSRIREEQEAVAYHAQVHHEEMTDDALFFSVGAADKWIGYGKAISEIHPLFPIPPAPHNCKELVEAGQRLAMELTDCQHGYVCDVREEWEEALAKHKASMGEK